MESAEQVDARRLKRGRVRIPVLVAALTTVLLELVEVPENVEAILRAVAAVL